MSLWPKTSSLAVDRQQLSLVLIVIIIWCGFGFISRNFLTQSNILIIVLQASATIVSAVGMTYVISTRGIDLSVGGIALCSVAIAVTFAGRINGDISLYANVSWLAFPIALAAGLVMGVINALVIIFLQINPLIATLGSMALYRGIGLHILQALAQALAFPVRGEVVDVIRTSVFGVSVPIIVALAFSTGAIFAVWQTPFGRKMLALGQSPRSAVETGISQTEVLIVAYGLSGLCAAVAGTIMLGRVGVLDAGLGLEFEFTVITAVVLGGTSLFGGSNRIGGSLVAAVLLVSIDNGLNIIGANPYIYQLVRGGVLLAATVLTVFANRGKAAVI